MSNGYLTTHVLDVYNGIPGKGIRGAIYRIEGENKKKMGQKRENSRRYQIKNTVYIACYDVNGLLSCKRIFIV